MRRLKIDRAAGFIHLGIDSLDDLWTLRNLIRPGDLVTASTTRTAEVADDKIRSEKAEKKRMTLGVRVESVEWHDFDDHLRVHGIIETGPQDHGRHHTLVLRDERGADVKIQLQGAVQGWHIDMIDEAVAAADRPQILLLAIDDSEAQFGQLATYGLRMLGSLPATGLGKGYDGKGSESAKKRFYDEVVQSLRGLRPDATTPLLVVGPGWWREEFLEHGKQKAPDVVQGARTDGVSQGGQAGLREAMRRGQLQQVVHDHRVHLETEFVDEVFVRIAKNGAVSYGPAETRRAIDAGAVETLLVTDEVVRTGKHEDLMAAAETMAAQLHIISTGHDAGHRLGQLGGVAALLRYALDPS